MQLSSFQKKINELLFEICWCHWRRLGAYSAGPINQCSTDPEVLILMTCLLGKNEKRLLEIMGQWIRSYGNSIPMDRFKSLLPKTFIGKPPYEHLAILEKVLHASLPRGEKKKWEKVFQIIKSSTKNLSIKFKLASIESRKKLDLHEKILRRNRQMAFRYLFGPGSRADICYLVSVISQQIKKPLGIRISASHFSKRLHYNRTSIYRIFVDLEKGLFIRKTQEPGGGVSSDYQPNKGRWILPLKEKTDKAYVDWLQIAAMAIQWKELEINLLKIKPKSYNKNPIVKVWYYQTWEAFQRFGKMALIPISYPPIPVGELANIPLDRILSGIEETLSLTYHYLTTPSH